MKVLVAIDGSSGALNGARFALQLASDGLRGGFVLATVQEPTYVYEIVLAPDAEVLDRLSGAVGTRALAGAEELFKAAGVAYERDIGSGEPAATLVEIARRCGCTSIVMGARGMGALRGALMGSVSLGVLERAGMPVTIVRDGSELEG